MSIDWTGQVAALVRDGYQGAISLETHWRGADGDRLQASIICGRTFANWSVRRSRFAVSASILPPEGGSYGCVLWPPAFVLWLPPSGGRPRPFTSNISPPSP